jgi:hypothetical protein
MATGPPRDDQIVMLRGNLKERQWKWTRTSSAIDGSRNLTLTHHHIFIVSSTPDR